jgi:hypothetical protein
MNPRLAYVAAGLSVIPLHLEHKGALVKWKERQDQAPTADEVAGWFRKWPDAMTGLVCGVAYGGIEVLDFDIPQKHEPGFTKGVPPLWATWRKMVEDHDPDLLPKLCIIRTRSGGLQAVYRCSVIEGNKKLAHVWYQPPGGKGKWAEAIETRGEGGYFATVPSPGYEILRGSLTELQEITEEERLTLWMLARRLDQKPVTVREEAPAKPRDPNDQADRVGDDFNARASWSDVWSLVDAGDRWTDTGHTWNYQGDSMALWRRPGKSHGWSGRTGSDGLLVVFTSSDSHLDNQTGYSKFRVYALKMHGGDWKAAALALAEHGYGTPAKGKGQRQRESLRKAFEVPTTGANAPVEPRAQLRTGTMHAEIAAAPIQAEPRPITKHVQGMRDHYAALCLAMQKTVTTPKGPGRLVQCIDGQARVVFPGSTQWEGFRYSEVQP